MFACFGYEYGMGKIISKLKSIWEFAKNYIKANEVARCLAITSIIIILFVILIGLR